jgi:endogenous inhibitor of DNA gyrase (YacG/DUF329 family)
MSKSLFTRCAACGTSVVTAYITKGPRYCSHRCYMRVWRLTQKAKTVEQATDQAA